MLSMFFVFIFPESTKTGALGSDLVMDFFEFLTAS